MKMGMFLKTQHEIARFSHTLGLYVPIKETLCQHETEFCYDVSLLAYCAKIY